MRVCRRCEQPSDDFPPGRAICRECKRAADRAGYAANRDARRETMRAYHQRTGTSAKARKYQRQYRVDNKDRYREHNRRARCQRAGVPVGDFTLDELRQRMAYWGNACWICSSPDPTEVDHVKPVSAGGAHLLCNLRPICGSCNRRKAWTWPSPYLDAAS